MILKENGALAQAEQAQATIVFVVPAALKVHP